MEALSDYIHRFQGVRKQTVGLPLEEARQLMHQFFFVPLGGREKVAKILDEKICSADKPIPLRIYIPHGRPPFPTVLFFDWGGWVFGGIEDADPLCRKLCNRTGAIIISVGYRLAPENPYPLPLNDCFAATKWAAQHAQEFLGNPKRLGVCGESAGGNLAAAVAIKAGLEAACCLALQVLIYPILSYEIDEESYRQCADQKFVTANSMRWFWKQYLPNGKQTEDALIAPLELKHFEALPKTILLTAGDDPLRNEGLAYARLLRQHKKAVVTLDYPRAVHGFLNFPIDQATREKALNELSKDIKIML